MEKLLFLNEELFDMIENSVSMEAFDPGFFQPSLLPPERSIFWITAVPIIDFSGKS